jgi:hypothetical protein
VNRRLSPGVLALAVLAALLAAPGSSVQAQPLASITLPSPGGTVQLYPGCNNVSFSFPSGTDCGTVLQAVTPAGAVAAMWRHNAALGMFEGFSPAAPQASDLLTVNSMDAVWLCLGEAPALAPPPPAPSPGTDASLRAAAVSDCVAESVDQGFGQEEATTWCNCWVDRLFQSVGADGVQRLMDLREGESPPADLEDAALDCLIDCVVETGVFRTSIVSECAAGLLQEGLVDTQAKATAVCECVMDKLLADFGPEGLRRLLEAGMTDEPLPSDIEATIEDASVECIQELCNDFPCAATGCTCDDFTSGTEAQWFYDYCKPLDPTSLDGDHDGRACEALQGCNRFTCWPSCWCFDFSTQAEAQWYYDTCDPNKWVILDGDRDGVACESLP